jgi:predicted nucleic acid-binding protein
LIVVSDASPLVGLAAVGQLELLADLYSEVVIPEAVFEEATLASPAAPGAEEIRRARWIRVARASDDELVSSLSTELDRGEAEAIALAVELEADLLLVDEKRARVKARQLGRRVIGVIGVLLQSKDKGLLEEIRPVLDALVDRTGFRVGRALYEEALEAAGELGRSKG